MHQPKMRLITAEADAGVFILAAFVWRALTIGTVYLALYVRRRFRR